MKKPIEMFSKKESRTVQAALDSLLPVVLPASWSRTGLYTNVGTFAKRDSLGDGALTVIVEVESHEGALWQHVSFSRNGGTKLPSWADVTDVKKLFIGDARAAVQVLPSADQHFSIAEVLHLFSPIGFALPLPDFRRDDGGL
jgi:hypothetical protein